MNPQLIPTNFKVPQECAHRWVFVAGPLRSEIKGIPGRKKLSIEYFQTGEPVDIDGKVLHSRHLDWMAYTVEHLRGICLED